MAKKILVVDDEEDVRETLSTVLENLDFEPYVAADGEEALEVIRQKPIDIILSETSSWFSSVTLSRASLCSARTWCPSGQPELRCG